MADENHDNKFDDGAATAEAYEVEDLSAPESQEGQDTQHGENTGIFKWVNGELVQVGTQAEDALSTIVNMQEQLEKRKKHIQEVKEEIDRLNNQLPDKIAERRRYSKEIADTDSEILLAEQRIQQLTEKETDYNARGEGVSVKLEDIARKYDRQKATLDKKKEEVLEQIDEKKITAKQRIDNLEKALEKAKETLREIEEKNKSVNDASQRRADAIQESYDNEKGELTTDYDNILAKIQETEKERLTEEEKYSVLKEKYQTSEDNCRETDESIAKIKDRIKYLAKDITNSSVTNMLRSATPESLALPSLELDYEKNEQDPNLDPLTDEDIRPAEIPVLDTYPPEPEEMEAPDLTDDEVDMDEITESQFSKPPYSSDDPKIVAERKENARKLINEFGINDNAEKPPVEVKDIGEAALQEQKYTPAQMNQILANLTEPHQLTSPEKEVHKENISTEEEDADIEGLLDGLEVLKDDLKHPQSDSDSEPLKSQMVKDVLEDPAEDIIPVSEAPQIVPSSIDLLSAEVWQLKTDGPIRTGKIQYSISDESEKLIEYVDTNMFIKMMSSNAYSTIAGIKNDLPGEMKTKLNLKQIEQLAQVSDSFESGWNNIKNMVDKLVSKYNHGLNELVTDYTLGGLNPEGIEMADIQERSLVCDPYLQKALKEEVLPVLLNDEYLTVFESDHTPESETIFREEIDFDKLVNSLDKVRQYLEENLSDSQEAVQKGGEGIEYVLQQKKCKILPVESAQHSD